MVDVLASLEKAVDLDIFESKEASVCMCFESELLFEERLNTRCALLEVEIVRYLFTIIRIVRPGMAGVGALELIK